MFFYVHFVQIVSNIVNEKKNHFTFSHHLFMFPPPQEVWSHREVVDFFDKCDEEMIRQEAMEEMEASVRIQTDKVMREELNRLIEVCTCILYHVFVFLVSSTLIPTRFCNIIKMNSIFLLLI